jgi:O-acetyl-ADP-ribose deacetylase (regulator of RNase III)
MFKQIAERFKPSKHQFVQKIRLHYGPILELEGCEVITFFMSPRLEWEGSLNHEVLALAGPSLDEYVLSTIDRPQSGIAYPLPPFNSGRRALFMGVLSEWDGGVDFDDTHLIRVYRSAIEQAQNLGFRSIAFPAMGKDKRDFPHIRFARLALQGVMEKLDDRIDEVVIACADKRMFDTYSDRLKKAGWKS